MALNRLLRFILLLGMTSLPGALIGETGSDATPADSGSAEAAAWPEPGPVKPLPSGVRAMVFYAPGDESRIVRTDSGRIDAIISAKGEKEPVLAFIPWSELDDLVYRIDAIVNDESGDEYPLSHIPSYYVDGYLPGPAAWEYLRPLILESDQAWTYGDRERGLVVFRNNQLFCQLICIDPHLLMEAN